MPWTQEELDYVQENYNKPGHSATSIALHVNKSRNAVIGKAHRLGIVGPHNNGAIRARKAATAELRRIRAAQAAEYRRVAMERKARNLAIIKSRIEGQPVPPVTEPKELIVEPIAEPEYVNRDCNCTLFELSDRTCRWPVKEGWYCGDTTTDGSPYCAEHRAMAWRPIPSYGARRVWR
jgi:GcrA cell cycle regulator